MFIYLYIMYGNKKYFIFIKNILLFGTLYANYRCRSLTEGGIKGWALREPPETARRQMATGRIKAPHSLLKELYMKRILIIVTAGLLAAGSLSAQAWGGRGNGFAATNPQTPLQAAETVKVEGKLALINGMIAVKSGTTTYYVGGLQG